MFEWLGAFILLGGFLLCLRLFGVLKSSEVAVTLAKSSLQTIQDKTLDDDAKEAATQAIAKSLFGCFFQICWRVVAALLAPAAVVICLQFFGLLSFNGVLALTVTPLFIVISVVVSVPFFIFKNKGEGQTSYSSIDRTLHQVAFSTYLGQAAASDVESRVYSKVLSPLKTTRPVFITSLPRAGTTLLLELCSKLPEFSTHTYRDMPFVLTPIYWSKFSKSFQKKGETRERAHGDGLMIDFDSPEAFEEILWKTFWRKHYTAESIPLWGEESDEEFEEFFDSHMRKIVFLRSEARGVTPGDYLSKNNGNIARLSYLRTVYPDALILVPYREPIAHILSLQRQHKNFTSIQQSDPFARSYMKGIGHFDFGLNLKPIDFDGWYEKRRTLDTHSANFWLEYWIAAHRHFLSQKDSICLISHERLCSDPVGQLGRLSMLLGTKFEQDLFDQAATIKPPQTKSLRDETDLDPDLLKEARELYDELLENTPSGD